MKAREIDGFVGLATSLLLAIRALLLLIGHWAVGGTNTDGDN